ncbi:glycoside hydrolase family 28 protein [Paenibacillus sp. UNC451MF]|uniref:glycoside hydrolase family 28 protein n=1 Tax=Paenibacillus sp. UNC451MF TaxID=1449063 RepID=UPI00068D264C|nr:glycoside hydrolase family 28 protein [Paenibacillus sp. UNC451MF]
MTEQRIVEAGGAGFRAEDVRIPIFPEWTCSVTDYGAIGDGIVKNTDAFNEAVTACAAAGGGTVIIPKGIWLTGPIILQSKVRLHAEAGALVTFSRDFDDYPLIPSNYEGLQAVRAMPPIYGENLIDVAITGPGIFDGSGDAWRCVKKHKMTDRQWRHIVASGGFVDANNLWWPTQEASDGRRVTEALQAEGNMEIAAYEPYKVYLRPVLVGLTGCSGVLLDGPTFQNSGSWNLHPRLCEHITIRHVTVRNPWHSVNGDGLDLESCRYANVMDSTFDVGDDAICLKSGKNEQGRRTGVPTEYVTIRNCTVYHGHGGFTVGSEMSGGVRHVDVSDCTFIGTDNGLRFKSTRGRGGIVENIKISNVWMKDIIKDAIVFDMYYEIKQEYADMAPVTEETPCFRNISITDTYCSGAEKGIFIRGLPEMLLQNLRFERVTVAADEGLTCIDAENLVFREVQVAAKPGTEFKERNCRNIRFEDAAGKECEGPRSYVFETSSK